MNIEDIKQRANKNALHQNEWAEHYRGDVQFLLQELEKVQRENERLIVSLQKLANATNDPSRVKWPEA